MTRCQYCYSSQYACGQSPEDRAEDELREAELELERLQELEEEFRIAQLEEDALNEAKELNDWLEKQNGI